MTKHIFRQVPPEQADFSFYFDDDGLTEASGDYCNILFIVENRNFSGLNMEEFDRVYETLNEVLDKAYDIANKESWAYESMGALLLAYGLIDNIKQTRRIKRFKEFFNNENTDIDKLETVAEYLTITTGKEWETASARGYRQGDFIEGLYCTESYPDGIQNYLEIWLGAGKEFSFIALDENGEEVDEVYGYIVADSEANDSRELKTLLCKWGGVPEEETELQIISGTRTYTTYEYEIS